MRPPRVVHLTTVDMSLALLLLPQLIAFRDAGYEVIGVSAPGEYVALLEEHGIRHVPLTSSTRAVNPLADTRAALEFGRICRRLRPDIVHTHNPKPGVYGRIVARLTGVPHVVNTVHGLYAQPTDKWSKRAVVYGLERLAASFSDAELLQNAEDLPVLRRLRIPDRKLHLLGNGIDLTRFDPERHRDARQEVRSELGVGPDEVAVGSVGRLVREKGFVEVIRAADRVRRDLPHVRFLVIGPYEPDKQDAIPEADLRAAVDKGTIVYVGRRHDVERFYAAMDIFLLASHREGFPRAAMEAAAMGLPIVATDIRGCRQVVDRERTGLLVPERDAEAITAGIARLASAPAIRQQMGNAGRRKAVVEFDDRRQIALTLETYSRLLAAR
jgi:glycosyltransferase involved in cell wall biosynthesis